MRTAVFKHLDRLGRNTCMAYYATQQDILCIAWYPWLPKIILNISRFYSLYSGRKHSSEDKKTGHPLTTKSKVRGSVFQSKSIDTTVRTFTVTQFKVLPYRV